ncbi:acetyl-CoA hydrolase/transferase family protein [Paracoccus sp. FO-3]|uniref:acetyl-CoA hydrolase/transferase family protein n=1 Tax=Paracoccus sp. FO-3 TaxID=1335059 RepID=UPI00112D730D|nr:acetyl-CoA hydrolase/transferase C-terminal domain-containing protein [Paracoccus sp. FO-3]
MPDLSDLIRPGDRILWGQSCAEPRSLIRRLAQARASLGGVSVFLGIGLGGDLTADCADHIRLSSYTGAGPNRALAKAGVLEILPVHYSDLPDMFASGALRIDVVFLQVPPPDAMGRYSLGMAREYLSDALAHARVVIGEVNSDAPWTFGGPYLRAADFDLLIPSDQPMAEPGGGRASETELAIARHVADLVPDQATLQTGVGQIPDLVLAALQDRRDLGIHTGSFGEGMAALCESGAVSNAHKPSDTGISTCGVLIGGAKLRSFAHLNPELVLRPTSHTHAPGILAAQHRFTAINSAIEVDLTGQINSEIAGGQYLGAVGGLADFLRGAARSKGGMPIVALPSTAKGQSRIVPRLSGPVSIGRADGPVIVTEFGVADLRGLSLRERAGRMISIAHPAHQEALEEALYASASPL